MNLFIIDQISRLIDSRDLINEAKRKRRRDNNLYLYDEYTDHVVVNCFLKRTAEKRKALFRLINVFLAISSILNSRNV